MSPDQPKIYHILHLDRLASVVGHGCLWSDAEAVARALSGTTVGMGRIKRRRLEELSLRCHPGLMVGQCVPFYFCPRSVMLYLLHRSNHPDLEYRGGQDPILHLQADLYQSVGWAEANGLRWAFTLSNAGSGYFEDRNDLARLGDIDWDAVGATNWGACREGKQAEFLVESRFPWHLVERIAARTRQVRDAILGLPVASGTLPPIDVRPEWYY
jgi:hypothetical protein